MKDKLPKNLKFNLGLGATTMATLTGDFDEIAPVLPTLLSPVEKATKKVLEALMRGDVIDRYEADNLVYQSS